MGDVEHHQSVDNGRPMGRAPSETDVNIHTIEGGAVQTTTFVIVRGAGAGTKVHREEEIAAAWVEIFPSLSLPFFPFGGQFWEAKAMGDANTSNASTPVAIPFQARLPFTSVPPIVPHISQRSDCTEPTTQSTNGAARKFA